VLVPHCFPGSPSPTNDPHTFYDEETLDGSSLSGDLSTILTLPARAGRRKTEAKPTPKKLNPNGKKTPNSKRNQRDPLAQPPLEPILPVNPSASSGYTTLAMLDLMAEVYTKVWDCYLKDLYNPLVDILKDIFAHNRLSRNLVDPKMRSVFEFFSGVLPATAYNLRRYLPPPTTGGGGSEASAGNSRSPSLSSTPRKECDAAMRPTSGQPPQNLPKKVSLHHQTPPPLADYPAANSHFFLFGRMLGDQILLPSPPLPSPPLPCSALLC
jgi:hypothetical protein